MDWEGWDGYAPQAQGAEVDEGGVHAVQAAQEAGDETAGTTTAQPEQEVARYRGPVRGRERVKKLDLTIANCQDCPFLTVYTKDIEVDDMMLAGGFYCLHQGGPEGRTQQDMTIVTHKQLRDNGKVNNFRGWMMEHEGAMVPRSCPLPDAKFTEIDPAGHRALDLGD